jgi:hypothetical protein
MQNLSKIDPKSLNTLFSLRMIYCSSTNEDIEYEGYIEEIMNDGVRLRARESCAIGHNIIFRIMKNEREILNGTGKIELTEENSGALHVVCTFNQFSEGDKKKLMEEAMLNQKEVLDYMDDLS